MTVRSILTFAADTRANTDRTKQVLCTIKINDLPTIEDEIRIIRVRNQPVKDQCYQFRM